MAFWTLRNLLIIEENVKVLFPDVITPRDSYIWKDKKLVPPSLYVKSSQRVDSNPLRKD